MEEQSEIPSKEQLVVSPELGERMASAKGAIEASVAAPEAEVAQPVEQLSFLAEMGQLAKENTVKRLGIMFKDVKAALGIIPFIPMISKARYGEQAIGGITKAVEGVGERGNLALGARKELSQAEKSVGVLQRKLDRTAASKIDQRVRIQSELNAAKRSRDSLKSRVTSAEKVWKKQATTVNAQLDRELNAKLKTLGVTKEKYDRFPDKVKRNILMSLRLPLSDEQMLKRYTQVDKHFAGMKKGSTIEERLQSLGNGEMPARNNAEKWGRRGKIVGTTYLLQALGPITDPAPDVPGIVVMGSLGAELLGQPWFGLIPPVWQYAHNRYEEMKTGWETSAKSLDIMKRHWNKRFDKMKDPATAKAAEAFIPTPVAAAA